jgi:hypothetical protein
MSLEALQALFWRGARGQASLSELDSAFLGRRAATGAARLRIYNGAYFTRLGNALADSFPATKRLLGDARFEELARRYVIRHPSERPALEWVGEHFARMLADRLTGADALAAGVAALEWARIEALLSPEDQALVDFSPAELAPEAVFFHWVRSLRLCASTVACFRSLQHQGSEHAVADRPLTVAFWRKGFQVHCRTLDVAEERALEGATAPLSLLSLCERLESESPGDTALPLRLIQRWLTQGWLRRETPNARPQGWYSDEVK